MVLKENHERLRSLLAQAIPMLCKSSLDKLETEFYIEALIGITLRDSSETLLVNFKETVTASGDTISHVWSDPTSARKIEDGASAHRKNRKNYESASTNKTSNNNRERKSTFDNRHDAGQSINQSREMDDDYRNDDHRAALRSCEQDDIVESSPPPLLPEVSAHQNFGMDLSSSANVPHTSSNSFRTFSSTPSAFPIRMKKRVKKEHHHSPAAYNERGSYETKYSVGVKTEQSAAYNDGEMGSSVNPMYANASDWNQVDQNYTPELENGANVDDAVEMGYNNNMSSAPSHKSRGWNARSDWSAGGTKRESAKVPKSNKSDGAICLKRSRVNDVSTGFVDFSSSEPQSSRAGESVDRFAYDEKHRPELIPPTPGRMAPKKRCRVCYSWRMRKEVRYCCRQCVDNPGLCLDPCFYLFHQELAQNAQNHRRKAKNQVALGDVDEGETHHQEQQGEGGGGGRHVDGPIGRDIPLSHLSQSSYVSDVTEGSSHQELDSYAHELLVRPVSTDVNAQDDKTFSSRHSISDEDEACE